MIYLVVLDHNVWIQVQSLRDTSCKPVLFALSYEFFECRGIYPNVIRAIQRITVLRKAKLLLT